MKRIIFIALALIFSVSVFAQTKTFLGKLRLVDTTHTAYGSIYEFVKNRGGLSVNNADILGSIGAKFYNGTTYDSAGTISYQVVNKTTGFSKIRMYANDGVNPMNDGGQRGLTVYGQNVGVGTATPSYGLHVARNAHIDSNLTVGKNFSVSNYDLISEVNDNYFGSRLIRSGIFSGTNFYGLSVVKTGGVTQSSMLYSNSTGTVYNSFKADSLYLSSTIRKLNNSYIFEIYNDKILYHKSNNSGSSYVDLLKVDSVGDIYTYGILAGVTDSTITSDSIITLPHSINVTITDTLEIDSINTASKIPDNGIVYLLFTDTAAGAGVYNGKNIYLDANFVYTPNDVLILQRRNDNFYMIGKNVNRD